MIHGHQSCQDYPDTINQTKQFLKDYRLISFIHTHTKILSKILAN